MLIMAIIWSSSMTNYYLILYLVNTFEMIYVCALCSAASEMLSYFVSGYVFDYLGARKTYFASFAFAFAGGVLLLAVGLQFQHSWTFVVMVMLAKFGIVSTQNVNYSAHPDVFPTLF